MTLVDEKGKIDRLQDFFRTTPREEIRSTLHECDGDEDRTANEILRKGLFKTKENKKKKKQAPQSTQNDRRKPYTSDARTGDRGERLVGGGRGGGRGSGRGRGEAEGLSKENISRGKNFVPAPTVSKSVVAIASSTKPETVVPSTTPEVTESVERAAPEPKDHVEAVPSSKPPGKAWGGPGPTLAEQIRLKNQQSQAPRIEPQQIKVQSRPQPQENLHEHAYDIENYEDDAFDDNQDFGDMPFDENPYAEMDEEVYDDDVTFEVGDDDAVEEIDAFGLDESEETALSPAPASASKASSKPAIDENAGRNFLATLLGKATALSAPVAAASLPIEPSATEDFSSKPIAPSVVADSASTAAAAAAAATAALAAPSIVATEIINERKTTAASEGTTETTTAAAASLASTLNSFNINNFGSNITQSDSSSPVIKVSESASTVEPSAAALSTPVEVESLKAGTTTASAPAPVPSTIASAPIPTTMYFAAPGADKPAASSSTTGTAPSTAAPVISSATPAVPAAAAAVAPTVNPIDLHRNPFISGYAPFSFSNPSAFLDPFGLSGAQDHSRPIYPDMNVMRSHQTNASGLAFGGANLLTPELEHFYAAFNQHQQLCHQAAGQQQQQQQQQQSTGVSAVGSSPLMGGIASGGALSAPSMSGVSASNATSSGTASVPGAPSFLPGAADVTSSRFGGSAALSHGVEAAGVAGMSSTSTGSVSSTATGSGGATGGVQMSGQLPLGGYAAGMTHMHHSLYPNLHMFPYMHFHNQIAQPNYYNAPNMLFPGRNAFPNSSFGHVTSPLGPIGSGAPANPIVANTNAYGAGLTASMPFSLSGFGVDDATSSQQGGGGNVAVNSASVIGYGGAAVNNKLISSTGAPFVSGSDATSGIKSAGADGAGSAIAPPSSSSTTSSNATTASASSSLMPQNVAALVFNPMVFPNATYYHASYQHQQQQPTTTSSAASTATTHLQQQPQQQQPATTGASLHGVPSSTVTNVSSQQPSAVQQVPSISQQQPQVVQQQQQQQQQQQTMAAVTSSPTVVAPLQSQPQQSHTQQQHQNQHHQQHHHHHSPHNMHSGHGGSNSNTHSSNYYGGNPHQGGGGGMSHGQPYGSSSSYGQNSYNGGYASRYQNNGGYQGNNNRYNSGYRQQQ